MSDALAIPRRAFCQCAAAAVLAAHAPLFIPSRSLAMPNESPPHLPLLALRLQTLRLDDMRRFYRETLGLPLVHDTARSISFRAGHTTLTFESPDEPAADRPVAPFYHFAFNIPENRLAEALEWIKARTPIVKRGTGEETFHFEHWNAHALYFLDPAGNIVEFIARHTLANSSPKPFTTESIGEVSEIGLIVHDVLAAVSATRTALGAQPYLGRTSDEFTAVGDERGLFIIVKTGRLWFPLENEQARPAQIFKAQITTRGKPGALRPFGDLPYEITRE